MIVAVYGTLRRGQGNYRHLLEGTEAEFVCEDRIMGTMFSLGGFPGILTGHNHRGMVVVDLFKIPAPSQSPIMDRLDRLEGYNKQGPVSDNMYNRKWTVTEGGRMCWYYEWNGELPSERVIESGDWLQHVAERHQIRLQQRA